MVEYHPDKNEDICDQLLISIGNKTIEVPLIGYVLFIIEANILSIFQMKIRVIVIFSILFGSALSFCFLDFIGKKSSSSSLFILLVSSSSFFEISWFILRFVLISLVSFLFFSSFVSSFVFVVLFVSVIFGSVCVILFLLFISSKSLLLLLLLLLLLYFLYLYLIYQEFLEEFF